MNVLNRRHIAADPSWKFDSDRRVRTCPSLDLGRPTPKNGCYQNNQIVKAKLCSAWQQLAASKDCFSKLKQDLLRGMAETNDIFNSMSVPLVRLVGLKVQQLSEQGRQTAVRLSSPLHSEVLQAYSPPALCSDNKRRRCSEPWQSAPTSPEENVTAKAAQHVAEFSVVQKQQLRQLVGVIKMVESLVRLQEEAVTERFQECDTYLDTLQQSSLVNFKNLHQQVMNMRQQDSHLAYRVRVAEQSYQALMSLSVKIQESGIDKARKNLLNVKVEIEGMIHELASSMCKPLVAFLKQLKGDNEASVVVSKLQMLVAEMNSRVSAQFQTLSAANEEYKAHAKKIDFQLQVFNKEVEKMSLDGETLRRSLKEKVEEVEALKTILAVEMVEKQNFKAQLDNEKVRTFQLEEELRQKETKLANAIELLEATKLEISQQHLQVTDACRRSKELCSQLAAADTKLSQRYSTVDDFLYKEAYIPKDHPQLTCVQQLLVNQPQVFGGASVLEEVKEESSGLWDKFFSLLSNGMAEMQSGSVDKAQLQEAIVLLSKHCGGQENSGSLRVVEALVLFMKCLRNRDHQGAMKEESFSNTELLLEKVEESFVFWLSEFKHMQDLVQHCQHIQESREGSTSTDSSKAQTGSFALDIWLSWLYLLAYLVDSSKGIPPSSRTSLAICSDMCPWRELGNWPHQLQGNVPGLGQPSSIFFNLVNAVACATVSKSECDDSQLDSKAFRQKEQQRRDVVQREREVGKPKVELLKNETSFESSSCEQGLFGNKRSVTGCDGGNQEVGTDPLPLIAKRLHRQEHNLNFGPRSQLQIASSTISAFTQKLINSEEGLNDHDAVASPKLSDSTLLPHGGGDEFALPLVEDGKGRPSESSKELWQVLELSASNNCNEKESSSINVGTKARELLSLTSRCNQQNSEPLLVLKDVRRRPPPPYCKRASPRLLALAASRLAHGPHIPSCK